MADDDLPDGITIASDRDTVSATGVVDAPPADVFDYIRRPANHAAISGDETVRGTTVGPELLSEGDRFGMSMKLLGLPYRVTSKVVEHTHGTRIAWCHTGGHRWRWELEPLADGRTQVTETFDLSTALFPPGLRLVGFPGRHRANVARSVANVAAHFGGTTDPA